MAKVYDEKKDALWVRAHLSDFDGSVAEWKDSFYNLWREQMTWGFAYHIEVLEYHSGDVGVEMYIKPSFKDALLGAMESYKYRNIEVSPASVGVVYGFEHASLDDIEVLVIDY